MLWNTFSVAMNFLAFLDEMWFPAARPKVTVPNSSKNFTTERTAGVFSRSTPREVDRMQLNFVGKFPHIFAGTSLLSCSLSWIFALKFHKKIETSLMKKFDL